MQSIMEKKLRGALAWCGGSDDFQVGGKSRDGWERLCAPLLRGKPGKRHCCWIGCPDDAQFEIYYEGAVSPDDSISTDACSRHLGALMTDAPVHVVFSLETLQ